MVIKTSAFIYFTIILISLVTFRFLSCSVMSYVYRLIEIVRLFLHLCYNFEIYDADSGN